MNDFRVSPGFSPPMLNRQVTPIPIYCFYTTMEAIFSCVCERRGVMMGEDLEPQNHRSTQSHRRILVISSWPC